MKMRIYGFSWVEGKLPSKVASTAVFERIARLAGKQYGEHLGAATKIGEWWAGVLLKVRDSKALTTLKEENGVLLFTAEQLENGKSLAEPNFFVAHESNGRGLYCHHHLSASLLGDFAYYCHHRFKDEVQDRLKNELERATELTGKEEKAIRRSYRGRLALEQILKPGTFDSHVRSLKRVTSLEVNLVSFELKEPLFQPVTMQAKRKRVSLSFPDDAHHGLITDGIAKCRESGMFEKATVVGRDNRGNEQTYKLQSDTQVFGTFDYDSMISSMSIKFDDLDGSIKKSRIIAELLNLGNDQKVRAVINI